MVWTWTQQCEAEGFVNCAFAQEGPCLTERHGALEMAREAEKERQRLEELEAEYAERYSTDEGPEDKPLDFYNDGEVWL